MFRRILLIVIPSIITCQVSCTKTEEEHPVRINIENLSDKYIDSLVITSLSAEANGYWLTHEPLVFYDLGQNQMGELQTRKDVGEVLHFKAFIDGDSALGKWIYPHHKRDPPYPVYLRSDDYWFGVIEADTVSDDLIIGLLTPQRW